MLIYRILFRYMLEPQIVQHNLFFSNILIYVLLLDFNLGLFALTVEKKLYFVQKFIMHLLVQCKTTLILNLRTASFTEQVLEINKLSSSSLSFRNLSFTNRKYILIIFDIFIQANAF